jgi:hypothetical protein
MVDIIKAAAKVEVGIRRPKDCPAANIFIWYGVKK